MAARNVKDTILSFGVLTIPVGVRKIEKRDGDFSWSMASPGGNAVKQTYVDEVTGEVVGSSAECLRGVFDDPKNKVGFHEVPAEARKAVDEGGKIDGIIIDGFIPTAEVPFQRTQDAYYIAPNGKAGGTIAAKSLRLLRDALAATDSVGVGKLTIVSKQRPFVLYERDGGLILNTLAYAGDFEAEAEAAEVFDGVEVDAKQVALATTLVKAQSTDVSVLNAYVDTTREQRADLLEAALSGQPITVSEDAAAVAPVMDLEGALLASIEAAAPKPKKKSAAKKAA